MRIWGKLMKDNRLVQDMVAEITDYNLSRTKKVYQALDEMCYAFDLAKPIWLKQNQQDFYNIGWLKLKTCNVDPAGRSIYIFAKK